MRWAAVIVAAGHGTRLGRPKQFLELAGLPMVGWSIQTFAAMTEIEDIVVATEREMIEPMRDLAARIAPAGRVRVVCGGASRQSSAFEGLAAISSDAAAVFVHDGARPLVCAADIYAGMREVREGRAALLATPVVDTIKRVDAPSRRVTGTLARETLWAAQTPQFATVRDLRAAHQWALGAGVVENDETALLESIGVEVVAVRSTTENFKVTHPADVARAEMILRSREITCHSERSQKMKAER